VISTSSPVTRTDDPAPAQNPHFSVKPETPAKPETPVVAKPKAPVAEQPVAPVAEKPAAPAAEKPEVITTPLPAPLPPVPSQEPVIVTPKDKPVPPRVTPVLPEPEKPDPAKLAACNDYASRAIEQNTENKRLSCGLTGSRWGYARTNYFDYCMRSPSSAYNEARAGRDSELASCKRDIAARRDVEPEPILPEINVPGIDDLFNSGSRSAGFCRNFAAQSVRQVREAEVLDCGFEGRIWSSSRVRQGQLCENVGPRQAAGILNDRARQIDSCRRSAGGSGDNQGFSCREYARVAVQQARLARRLDCGYNGARWTQNYRAHFNWCRRVSESKSSQEFRVREQLLAQCE
jgi:hypothetical protein